MPALYLNTGHSAGEECSSTYEGRHLTLEERYLTHPDNGDGFVDKGDPVVCGNIVGVAFRSAAAETDLIAIDTEGIWFLTAYGLDDEGNSAIAPGDKIFINTSTCVLSKITDFETQLPFGYALGDVTTGTSAVVAIKVHWDPLWWDLYHSNATATADNGVSINVVDTGASTGMGRALNISYMQNGVKNAPGEVDGINIDMDLRKACSYAYGLAAYFTGAGDPAIDLMSALSIYLDEMGTGIVSRDCIDMGKVSTNKASSRETFVRAREHGTAVGDSVLLLEGPNNLGCATYLVDLENGGGAGVPFVLAAVGGDQTAKIAVCWNGTPYYIPLHTA